MHKTLAIAACPCGVLSILFALTPLSAIAAADVAGNEPAAVLQFTSVTGAGGVPLNVVSAGDPSNPSILKSQACPDASKKTRFVTVHA